MFNSWQNVLQQVDWIYLNYRLRFSETFTLPAWGLLRLRRELLAVAKAFPQQAYAALLRPALPVDPHVLRQVQQPSPGFIFNIEQLNSRTFGAANEMTLSVGFLGQATNQLPLFSQLLAELGQAGLFKHQGRFVLEQIDSATSRGEFQPIWQGGPLQFSPRIFTLLELIDDPPPRKVSMQFCTPARLLKQGKPLFRASFADIFPFILRRVTSMLAVWGRVENLFDIGELLRCASQISSCDNRLVWQDWRPLGPQEEAGGLSGSLHLSGQELALLWPVLRLGELFGVGKSAAFGAGRYLLSVPDD